MKPTVPSQKCIDLIERFEGCKLEAYLCPAGVWTIGIGTTRYANGQRVKQGDKCTKGQAYQYLLHDIAGYAKDVDDLTVDGINQNQFDALVSFVYNCGRGNYQASTLRKMVNRNPNDTNIRAQFMRWINAGGRPLKGLERRRAAEADLYFGL